MLVYINMKGTIKEVEMITKNLMIGIVYDTISIVGDTDRFSVFLFLLVFWRKTCLMEKAKDITLDLRLLIP